jgi:hypothetical protein
MCSDSLISGGDINSAQSKIVPFSAPKLDANIAVAYAGSVSHCWNAIHALAKRIDDLSPADGPLTGDRFRDVLTETLLSYYPKQIFQHPRYGYYDGPQIYLVAALQSCGETRIFKTDETAVNEFGDYVFAGVGESIARYIVEPLIVVSLASMHAEKVLLLADHMLHQVKRFVPGCGDVSQFFYISNDLGFCAPARELLLPEERSDTFRRIVADLFYASADLDLDDDLVNIGLHLTDRRITQIRQEQLSERERRKALGPKLFTNPLIGIGPNVDRYKPPTPSDSQTSGDQQ